MNATQEHASPYPSFESVPMPQNATESHFLLVLAIVTWLMVGFVLGLRMDKKNK